MPMLWLLIMLLYPIISAYPQELIYRSFFFHRYKLLFKSEKAMVITNAALYSFLHIIYLNIVAPVLTLIAGYLFCRTYLANKSVLMPGIEHALYGMIVFTTGLGVFFYAG